MKSSGGTTAKQAREANIKAGTEFVDAKKSIFTIRKCADTPTEAGLYLAVVETDGSGNTVVKSFITNERLVNEALALIGKSLEKSSDDSAEKQKQRVVDEASAA